MTEVKLYKSPIKGLILIGLSSIFVGGGIWMLSRPSTGSDETIIMWMCIGFFGLGGLVGLFQVFDRRPQIIIDENGIWDRMLRQDPIKWEQITSVYPYQIQKQKFISIKTDATYIIKKRWNRWLAKMNRWLGAQALNLNLSFIKVDVNQLADLIDSLSKAEREERAGIIQMYQLKLERDKG